MTHNHTIRSKLTLPTYRIQILKWGHDSIIIVIREFSIHNNYTAYYSFHFQAAKVPDPGIRYDHKWSAGQSTIPGKLHKSTHPASDAYKKKEPVRFSPVKPGKL